MRPLFGRQRAFLLHRPLAHPEVAQIINLREGKLQVCSTRALAFARISGRLGPCAGSTICEKANCKSAPSSLLASLHRPEAIVRERLEGGRVAYVALLGVRPVSVAWVARDPAQVWDLDMEIIVGPGDAYIYDVYTAPAYRNLGIAAALDNAAGADLAQDGVRGLVRCVMAVNPAGLAAARKAGYLPRAEMAFVRAGGLEVHLVRYEDGRVAIRPSLAAVSRPYAMQTERAVGAAVMSGDGGWWGRVLSAAARRCVGRVAGGAR